MQAPADWLQASPRHGGVCIATCGANRLHHTDPQPARHRGAKHVSAIPPPAPPTMPHPSETARTQASPAVSVTPEASAADGAVVPAQDAPAKTAEATAEGAMTTPEAGPKPADKSAHPVYHFTPDTPRDAVWPMTFGPRSGASDKIVACLKVCCSPLLPACSILYAGP